MATKVKQPDAGAHAIMNDPEGPWYQQLVVDRANMHLYAPTQEYVQYVVNVMKRVRAGEEFPARCGPLPPDLTQQKHDRARLNSMSVALCKIAFEADLSVYDMATLARDVLMTWDDPNAALWRRTGRVA